MTPERQRPPQRPKPAEQFGLTERERLFARISHKRLLQWLDDPQTQVHRLEESTNSFGEYLFVTLSRPGEDERVFITFYGLGYHEYRERWITEEWFWYPAVNRPDLAEHTIRRDAVKEHIERRYRTTKGYASQETQSRRGQVFELIADFTDEDGAYAEMQDLPGWLLDDLQDEEDDLR